MNLCAVDGCSRSGWPKECPFDGHYHHHGRIHYGCGIDTSGLSYRDGWNFICDLHYRRIMLALRVAGLDPETRWSSEVAS